MQLTIRTPDFQVEFQGREKPADYSPRSSQLNSNQRNFRGLVVLPPDGLRIGRPSYALVDPVRVSFVRERFDPPATQLSNPSLPGANRGSGETDNEKGFIGVHR